MAIHFWTPDTGLSEIIFEGIHEIRDMYQPVPGKDEWGVDTLERLVRGPGDLFEHYGQQLRQGDTFQSYWKLQSWRPYEDPIFPGYFLSYKGFARGALPNPLQSTTRSQLVSSLMANDLSVSYAGKTIIAATREIQYMAPQTTYRYISDGEPTGQRFSSVRGGTIQNLSSQTTVTFDDGTSGTIAGNTPAGVSSALFTTPYVFTIGPSFDPILGTSYFECTEVCQLKYPGA